MAIIRTKKYVLTGGPGVGKSTLIELLEARGYLTILETARMIIETEQIKNSDVVPWKNLQKFQNRVAEIQLQKETGLGEGEIFLDRGIIDGYAYCKLGNIAAPGILVDNARGRYDKVFLLAPLPGYENDPVRKEKKKLQAVLHAMIEDAYREFGYDLISVPVLPIHERVEFILDAIRV